jgi:hypothetical protein
MKILLGDFSAKVGKEDIFKPRVGNEIYMKFVMIMELTVVSFATLKSLSKV